MGAKKRRIDKKQKFHLMKIFRFFPLLFFLFVAWFVFFLSIAAEFVPFHLLISESCRLFFASLPSFFFKTQIDKNEVEKFVMAKGEW